MSECGEGRGEAHVLGCRALSFPNPKFPFDYKFHNHISSSVCITMPPLPTTYPRDLKHPEMLNEKDEAMFHHRTNRRNRPFAVAFAAVALCYVLWTAVSRPHLFQHFCHGQASGSKSPMSLLPQAQDDRPLVPLEAHIMSKCPDARVGFIDMLSITNTIVDVDWE